MTSAYTEFPHSSSGRMEATATGQTRVVPLQNVAYDMSQRINHVLTVEFPPKRDSGIRTCYALTRTNHSVLTLSCSHRGQKGVYRSGGGHRCPIFSRHQQVIPGHKCAATVGETDGWIRHGESGEERKRKVGGWMNNLNPFTDNRPRYCVNPRPPAAFNAF